MIKEVFKNTGFGYLASKDGDYLLWIPENEAYQLLTEEEFNEQFETL